MQKAPMGGYLDTTAAVSLDGWRARAELGAHPAAGVALFAFGEAGARWGSPITAMTGLGARVVW